MQTKKTIISQLFAIGQLDQTCFYAFASAIIWNKIETRNSKANLCQFLLSQQISIQKGCFQQEHGMHQLKQLVKVQYNTTLHPFFKLLNQVVCKANYILVLALVFSTWQAR